MPFEVNMNITYNDLKRVILVLNLERQIALNNLLTSRDGDLNALREVYKKLDSIINELTSYTNENQNNIDTGFASYIERVNEVNKL